MGRGRAKRGRTQRRDFRDGRENIWKKPRDGSDAAGSNGWAPFILESPAFEAYYKTQRIMSEEDWDNFLTSLRKPLPTTFRINGSGQFALKIRDQMQRDFFDSLKDETEIDGEKIEPARPLSWYPDNLAWHLSFSRTQLRKVPVLQRIHEFLKHENEVGSITRQEAVSMVPPLFLDVQPEHRVLDMCAAPGSKTFQLLEAIHKEEQGVLPKGAVIANDSDLQRCNLLIHQTKRMSSPNILVTNHEAQHFPGLKCKSSGDDIVTGTQLTFERILCDVPCSGDGTIRKAPDIWKKWNPGTGNGLHRLQIQIAMRGVALLEVGGRMVYSTCSLNPIEDEAVVGEILRRSEGCMELLDVSSELPQLKRRPGLTTWKVRGKKRWFSTYSSYEADKIRMGFILPSMFPSGNTTKPDTEVKPVDDTENCEATTDVSEEGEEGGEEGGEVSDLPLERCMRILPHDQDTGGFFIAVLKKVSPYTSAPKSVSRKRQDAAAPEEEASAHLPDDIVRIPETKYEEAEDEKQVEDSVEDAVHIEDGVEAGDVEKVDPDVGDADVGCADVDADVEGESKEGDAGVGDKLGEKSRWRGTDPVLFLKDEEIISSLISYYGIEDSFPLIGHLIVRSEDTSRVKRIYYISKSVAEIFQLNFQAKQSLKMTSAGLKIFERHSNKEINLPCHFRIASEGLHFLLPHMTKQKLYASREDFRLLLMPNPVQFNAFEDSEFSNAVQQLHVGCCVVVLKDDTEDGISAIGCWRGRSNMSLLVPRIEADQLLHRLFTAHQCQTL